MALVSMRVSSTIAATIRTGPTIMMTTYSVTRRARLRGRSTCQVKLSAPSIFSIITITV